MNNLNTWDWLLLAGAGYLAVTSLARLMERQRKIVLGQLQHQVEQERLLQAAEKAKAKRLKEEEDARAPRRNRAA